MNQEVGTGTGYIYSTSWIYLDHEISTINGGRRW